MIRGVGRTIASAALAASLMACGGSPEPSPAPIAAGTPPAPVALVSTGALRASVPQLAGWTRGEATTQEGPAATPAAHVMVTFARGTEKMDLEIADTGGDQKAIETLEHMAGSTVNRKVDNGYFKGTIISTFPAVESWNTVDKIGELSVLIRRRFIIHVAGSGLADAAPMRALAEAVDTSRLR